MNGKVAVVTGRSSGIGLATSKLLTSKGAGATLDEDGGGPPFLPDTQEYAAGKILEAIETGAAEVFAHDWMKNAGKTQPSG